MPDPNKQTTDSPKEVSTELRTVLAFILMGIILVGTPYVYRALGIATPTADSKKAETKAATKSAPNAGAPMSPSAPVGDATPAQPAAAIAATAEQEQVIDTDLYRVVFSNRGAVVKSWTLKKYSDSVNKPLEVVNAAGAQKTAYPFSFVFRDRKPSADLNTALWVGHVEGLTVSYEFSDGSTSATKTFGFQRDGSIVQYADSVLSGGTGLAHLVQWRGGFGDMAVQNAAGLQATIRYDADKQKLVRDAAKSAKNGPVHSDGTFTFAGIDDQYFAAAFLPVSPGGVQTTTFDDVVASQYNKSEDPYPGVAVGGSSRNQFGVYIGPKAKDILHAVNPKLDGIIDWGTFGFIAQPLFLVLHWMNDAFLHNYGISIVVLTLLINVAMFPLKLTQLSSMRKMQKLQPEMNAINNKYKGISMSDPRAQHKQQEIMDLYKKHGVNPMGGCLPLLAQMPFLWAFYKVLAVTIEMRHAGFLWVGDLSQPEHLAIRVLPLVMVVTSFLAQKMTPMQPGADPSQQRMMQMMPLMYLFFFWNASSGLVLYWLTGNVVGIAQQWFFNKTAAPATAARVPQVSDGGKRRLKS